MLTPFWVQHTKTLHGHDILMIKILNQIVKQGEGDKETICGKERIIVYECHEEVAIDFFIKLRHKTCMIVFV